MGNFHKLLFKIFMLRQLKSTKTRDINMKVSILDTSLVTKMSKMSPPSMSEGSKDGQIKVMSYRGAHSKVPVPSMLRGQGRHSGLGAAG